MTLKHFQIRWPQEWLKRTRLFRTDLLSYSGKDFIVSVSLYLVSVICCLVLRNFDPQNDTSYVSMIFLLDVFLTALLTDGFFFSLTIAVFAVLSVDYIFTPPFWEVSFTLAGFPLTFLVMMTISILTATVTSRAKQTEQVKPEAKAPAVLDKVTVDLEAEGDCWLEASADGKELFAGILHAKESKHFEAKDKLIVKYGNIGVVRIKVNGEAVDLKGEHGVAVKTYLRNAPAQPAAAAKAEEAAPQPEAETKAAPAAAVEEAPQPAAAAPAPKAEEPKPQAEVKQAEPQQPQAAGEAKADKKK